MPGVEAMPLLLVSDIQVTSSTKTEVLQQWSSEILMLQVMETSNFKLQLRSLSISYFYTQTFFARMFSDFNQLPFLQ